MSESLAALLNISGKQKSTCLAGWSEFHQRLWPGHEVPDLLHPITSAKPRSQQQQAVGEWFVEQTVPTSFLVSIFGFGLSNKKRNLQFRAQTAQAVSGLASRLCQQGVLSLVTRPLGQAQAVTWRLPPSTCLPLACYVSSARLREQFSDDWAWEAKDSHRQ